MFFNQKPSVPFHSSVQLISCKGIINHKIFADYFFQFFMEISQSLMHMIVISIFFRNIDLFTFLFGC